MCVQQSFISWCSGVKTGFGAKTSLPLTQSSPAVSYNTTRFSVK